MVEGRTRDRGSLSWGARTLLHLLFSAWWGLGCLGCLGLLGRHFLHRQNNESLDQMLLYLPDRNALKLVLMLAFDGVLRAFAAPVREGFLLTLEGRFLACAVSCLLIPPSPCLPSHPWRPHSPRERKKRKELMSKVKNEVWSVCSFVCIRFMKKNKVFFWRSKAWEMETRAIQLPHLVRPRSKSVKHGVWKCQLITKCHFRFEAKARRKKGKKKFKKERTKVKTSILFTVMTVFLRSAGPYYCCSISDPKARAKLPLVTLNPLGSFSFPETEAKKTRTRKEQQTFLGKIHLFTLSKDRSVETHNVHKRKGNCLHNTQTSAKPLDLTHRHSLIQQSAHRTDTADTQNKCGIRNTVEIPYFFFHGWMECPWWDWWK